MPDPQARVDTLTPGVWTNFHGNVNEPVESIYDVFNPPNPRLSDLRATIAAIQTLMSNAARDGKRLRAVGGTWSLSPAAWTNGSLITTGNLKAWFMLGSNDFDTEFAGPRDGVAFVQCGLSIDLLNSSLKRKGRALRAAGASDGQTIVGALATGTHGSAFRVGALHDHVVGLQIITGPDSVVWLERESYPVASQSLVDAMGATLKRNDELFEAALVSFGSFGFVHGILLETDPLYLLTTHRVRRNLDTDLFAALSGFDPSKIGVSSTSVVRGDPAELYHFEAVINPNDPTQGWVTTMYKSRYRTDYQPPGNSSLGPGPDLLSRVGRLVDYAPGPLGQILRDFSSKFYGDTYEVCGTYGEIFSTTNPKGRGTSTELGFSPTDLPRVLDLVFQANARSGPFGGFGGIRFVKQSRATLAFTRFGDANFGDVTCTLELLGLDNDTARRFYADLWSALDGAGITYTFHWGQVNNYTPQRVRSMYGEDAVRRWKTARTTLLDAAMQAVFTSPYLEGCGLNGAPEPISV